MTKTANQILLDAIQGCRDDIAGVDRDLAADRTGNEKVAMTLVALQEQIGQLIKRLELIENKIKDRVSEAIAPAMEQAEDLSRVIQGKKVIVIDKAEAKKQKRHWWQWRR